MGNKRKYTVYRDDDSDDANDVDIPQSRTLLISANRRAIIETPHSPQKKGSRSKAVPPRGNPDWEPSADFEDGLCDEKLVGGGNEVAIADKLAAKRYPTSVSSLDYKLEKALIIL
jgi:hypothetical protein